MNLQWYVLNYDFNKRKIEYYNIFNHSYFIKCIQDLLDNFTTMENFIVELDKKLMYCFWSKREFEISIGDAFETDINQYVKFDVYSQIKPNITILAKYILDNNSK